MHRRIIYVVKKYILIINTTLGNSSSQILAVFKFVRIKTSLKIDKLGVILADIGRRGVEMGIF
jgi:hypothetical protein